MASMSFKPARALAAWLFGAAVRSLRSVRDCQGIQEISAGKMEIRAASLVFGLSSPPSGGLVACARFRLEEAKQEQAPKEAHTGRALALAEDWARGEVKSAEKGAIGFHMGVCPVLDAIPLRLFRQPTNERKAARAPRLSFHSPACVFWLGVRQTLRWNVLVNQR